MSKRTELFKGNKKKFREFLKSNKQKETWIIITERSLKTDELTYVIVNETE